MLDRTFSINWEITVGDLLIISWPTIVSIAVVTIFQFLTLFGKWLSPKSKYKINREDTKFSKQKLYLIVCFINSLFYISLYSLSFYFIMILKGYKMNYTIPNYKTIIIQSLSLLVIDDFIYYWSHRLLHYNKVLLCTVHSVHHKVLKPIPISTYFIHSFELLMVSTGMAISTAIINPYIISYCIFVVLRITQDVKNHCGWDFGYLDLFNWIPFHNTTKMHDNHHYKKRPVNMSNSLYLWDWLFGTYYPDNLGTKDTKEN